MQTCQVKSADSQVHDWVVYRLGDILGSVGHRIKIHKITPVTGKDRGDLEIKDYVDLQKPQAQADQLPPPRTLILDFTMTHPHYGRSHLYPIGQLTNISNRLDPIVFLSVAVDTSTRIFDDFLRLLFLHSHREASALATEIPEESGHFRFLRAVVSVILRGQWG